MCVSKTFTLTTIALLDFVHYNFSGAMWSIMDVAASTFFLRGLD